MNWSIKAALIESVTKRAAREDRVGVHCWTTQQQYPFLFGTKLDSGCAQQPSTIQRHRERLKPVLANRASRFSQSSREPPLTSAILGASLSQSAEEIVRGLKESRCVIIKGGTGSGKTTQVPQLLLQRLAPQGLIGCTQPRRIAAVSVTERVAQAVGPEKVGYRVRFEDRQGSRIKYLTEGILLREIEHNPALAQYSVVIIDEVHEKTVESLLLIKYLSRLTRTRANFYLVVMSATIEEEVVKEVGAVPMVELEHRPYSVAVRYSASLPADYLIAAAEKVVELARANSGNILVFLTGVEDLTICYHLLRGRVGGMALFLLHAKLSLAQQQAAILSAGPKCLLATNIAETSLTVPGIVHVVDCGMYKEMVYDPERNARVMVTAPIQKPMAEQRAGRTGRTANGVCHRLYPKEVYLSLHESTPSRASTKNMEQLVLRCLAWGLPFSPSSRTAAALKKLTLQNLLINDQITLLGKKVLSFPLSTNHALFLIEAVQRGCGWEAAVILAMIEVVGEDYRRLAEKARSQGLAFVPVPGSDHLSLLRLYQAGFETGLLTRHQLRQAARIITQLCQTAGAQPQPARAAPPKHLLAALRASHPTHLARATAAGAYDLATRTACRLARRAEEFWPPVPGSYLVYDELVDIHHPVLSIVSVVPPPDPPESFPNPN